MVRGDTDKNIKQLLDLIICGLKYIDVTRTTHTNLDVLQES